MLPGFAVDDPRGASITVRHLLAHTSGLAAADVDEFALPPAPSSAALVAGLRDVPLARDPGTAHEYLNANYVVAARIVETVTGRPFGEHLRAGVLLPLGMTATVATDRCDAAVPGLALGHVGALGVQVPVPEIPAFCAGDGGVVTTAADLTRWLRFQTGDGAPLLTAASLREAHTAAPGTDGRYGLGWSVRDGGDGGIRVLHDGALTTWTSAIELSPTGAGAFVLTDAAGAPSQLAAQLVGAADGAAPQAAPADPLRAVNLVLAGLTVLAGVLLTVAVLRAGRRARALGGRRRVLSLPAVAVAAGVLLLPLGWALVAGPSWTSWLMLLWMLPLGGILAFVLVTGGVVALVARARAGRSALPEVGDRSAAGSAPATRPGPRTPAS
ncbi:serine hydrolase [Pseudonocardia ammonioxydans]|uniref:serine hydrolase n=1 Tax=Pseudonocardia ammonioxydans TaxID=260086 RepID=UPI000B8295B6